MTEYEAEKNTTAIIGLFAGKLNIDENTTLRGKVPGRSKNGGIDDKNQIKKDSIVAGGSAANAAITFGVLAQKDKSRGGIARLYTKSTKATRPDIKQDLRSHNVDLKKLHIIPELQLSTIVSQPSHEGDRWILQREFEEVMPTSEKQKALQKEFKILEEKIGNTQDEVLKKILEQFGQKLTAAFNETNGVDPNIESQLKTNMDRSNIVMLDMNYFDDVTSPIGQLANEKKTTVVLDLGRWDDNAEELIAMSDIVIASHDFCTPDREEMSSEEILDYLQAHGVKKAAVTNGGDPTAFRDGNKSGAAPVPKPFAKGSTSSCGDIEHGAFCYFYAKTEDFEHALTEANKVSSLAASFPETREFFKHIDFNENGKMVINNPFNKAPANDVNPDSKEEINYNI